MKKRFKITGMHCTSCAQSIESVLSYTEGVEDVALNIVGEVADVEYDAETISEDGIIEAIEGAGYGAYTDGERKRLTLVIEGMHCANCVQAVEKTLESHEGVEGVRVNLASHKAHLTYNTSVTSVKDLKRAVQSAGYDAALEASSEEDPDEQAMETAKKKMQAAAILAGIVMALMVVHMFITPVPLYLPITAVLGAPVIFYLGLHVHKGSLRSVRNLSPNMDVLVSLGSVPPFIIGLAGLFFPITTFIEMATAIMTFHLIGKFLETRAKGKASQAIKKLVELGAKTARIETGGETREVDVAELEKGDVMLVRPGEKVPTDGVVKEGETSVDESLATGESMPVSKAPGDEVIGATINKQGFVKVEVSRTGKETFLSQVIDLVEEAQSTKVPIQAFADKVTGYFVPVVLILTALTFTSFLVFTDFHTAVMSRMDFLPWVNPDQSPLVLAFVTATAVLVIACPCALGLGTPTALMVGSGMGAKKGVLLRSGEAVQTLKDIDMVAFDKTGTLTYGEPVVTDIHPVMSGDASLIATAAALEQHSEHPIARAILDRASEEDVEVGSIKGFEAVSGKGVKGTMGDATYYIGNRSLMDAEGIDYSHLEDALKAYEDDAKTTMIIASGEEVLGIIAVSDVLKPHASRVISTMETMGIKTAMITGDNETTARAIARKAGLSHVVAAVLPDGKVDEIKRLQKAHGLVAMVGDGINDAPALKQADVGIALGSGTDVAIEAADVTLIRDEIALVAASITLSKRIFRKIKENYFWAWVYNAIAIPFAMLGLLHPMIGAAAMSLSSLNVVYNSLRLRRADIEEVPHGRQGRLEST